jgi:hypothetical protein
MTPYREAPEAVRPKLAFGQPRRAAWSIVGGLLLLALTLGILGAGFFSRVHVYGSVFWPGAFGLFLLMRARWGSMELWRDRGVLSIVRRGLWPWKRQEVPIAEVQTVEVVASSMRQKKADYVLNLVMAGDRTLPLLRGATMEALEADRSAIAAFLVDNRLLWGGRIEEPGESARVRVAETAERPADAADAADVDDAAQDEERRRRAGA